MVRLLTTCLTPLTFLASLVALSFCRCVSTAPEMVTTPCFESTTRAPPLTSASPESLMRTWSTMRSSLTGLSAARQTLASMNRIASTAQILEFIFSGHCTPVESIQKVRVLPPPRLHPNVQVEIDLHPENPLHLLPRQGPDLFEHRALGPDYAGLLPVALHPHRAIDARQRGRLLPAIHHHRHRVRHFL